MKIPGDPVKVMEQINENYGRLDEYTDIPGLIELRDFLDNIKNDNSYFKFMAENTCYDLSDECVEYNHKCKYFKHAFSVFGGIKFAFKLSDMSYAAFVGLYSIIAFSSTYHYGRELSYDEKIKILRSSLVCKISLGLDDFEKVENWRDVDKKFFKRVAAIKWDNRSRKLHSELHDLYIFPLGCLYHMDTKCISQFALCSRYLTNCLALSRGLDNVTPDILVEGWFLTFKFLKTDLRYYIDLEEWVF